jgi:hypothetical protein
MENEKIKEIQQKRFIMNENEKKMVEMPRYV